MILLLFVADRCSWVKCIVCGLWIFWENSWTSGHGLWTWLVCVCVRCVYMCMHGCVHTWMCVGAIFFSSITVVILTLCVCCVVYAMCMCGCVHVWICVGVMLLLYFFGIIMTVVILTVCVCLCLCTLIIVLYTYYTYICHFQALSVGIFPYVLKLLQSSAKELRPLLVFLWAKIMAVDSVSSSSQVPRAGWWWWGWWWWWRWLSTAWVATCLVPVVYGCGGDDGSWNLWLASFRSMWFGWWWRWW